MRIRAATLLGEKPVQGWAFAGHARFDFSGVLTGVWLLQSWELSGGCQKPATYCLESGHLFAQFTAQNLAGRGFWHGIHEAYFARLLVMSQPIGDE